VNDLRAFSADGFVAGWIADHGELTHDAVEQVSLRWDNEAWTATVQLPRHRVDAVFRLSPMWQVRQFMLFRDLEQPDLWLGTDGHGRWGEVNGAHRPDLDGAVDITVAGSLFGHAIPIRRLPLATGEAAQLTVLTVDVETLAVLPIVHTYARLGDRQWAVNNAEGEQTFDVDDHGVPLDTADRRRSQSESM
jgi:hypothetical protein